MEKRVYNFSAGPAVLPLSALEEAQRDLVALPGVGSSILEISHRSQPFSQIIEKAEGNLRQLLAIPDNYRVLFLQGFYQAGQLGASYLDVPEDREPEIGPLIREFGHPGQAAVVVNPLI